MIYVKALKTLLIMGGKRPQFLSLKSGLVSIMDAFVENTIFL